VRSNDGVRGTGAASISPPPESIPATEWSRVTSNASCRVITGRIVGSRRARNEKALLALLSAIPAGTRRDLLKVLLADSEIRADLIRQMYEREDTRNLAEVLMDLESDDVLRVTVIGLLDQLGDR
jgi:hypothetical protein